MSVEVICPGCAKSYRVAEKYAGKTATCKACGAKMRVPNPEPEPVAVDADGFDFSGFDSIEQTGAVDQSYAPPVAMAPPMPAPTAAPSRPLAYAHPATTRQSRTGGDTFVDQLRDRWLPIGLIAVCYALPLLISTVKNFMNAPGGYAFGQFISTVVGVGILVRIVIPIAVYGLGIAARMTNFEPPADANYRLFAAYCSVPGAIQVFILVVGATGVARGANLSQILTMIAMGLGLGLAISYFLLWFLLDIGPGQAAAAWVFGGLFFILGGLAGGLVLIVAALGIGLVFGGFMH